MGCITTMAIKNWNGAPHTQGEGENAGLFLPNGKVNRKIVCGSNMITGYISSYLFITDSEIKTDWYKVYSSVCRSFSPSSPFSPSNWYLFFVQCYLASFCCNLLPHSSTVTIITLSYVSEGGSGIEFLCKNWYPAKVRWSGFLGTLFSLCSD